MLRTVKDHLLQGLTDDSETIRSVCLSVCLSVSASVYVFVSY